MRGRRMPSYEEDTTRGLPSVRSQMERSTEDPRLDEIMRQQAEEERRRSSSPPATSSVAGMRERGVAAGMKSGGAVKKMAAGGKVRGCGIASKGKTRGKIC